MRRVPSAAVEQALNERPADSAIGAGHESNCIVDLHEVLASKKGRELTHADLAAP